MSSLAIKEFKGQSVRIRPGDRYVCLTDMAKSVDKKVNDWLRLNTTTELLQALEPDTGIPVSGLLEVNKGGIPELQGTWAHPQIALDFAQWCSVSLKIQCLKWLDELLTTGRVELAVKPERVLPPVHIQLTEFTNALTALGIDLNNPRYSQAIKDLVLDKILGVTQALPEHKETWLGVAEKAEQMGYPTALVVKNRSSLGKFVKANSDNLVYKSESRLCNGTMRQINLYLDCDLFGEVVSEFMDAKTLAAAKLN